MPKYPGISPYDNEKGTLGTAKKRWEKIYVKEIESDTVSGMEAEIENLATTAENSVSAAVSAKNDAVAAKTAAQAAQTAAETAAAGIQSVVETDVDNTLSIPGVAADAKVTGDWLNAIAKPVTGDTSLPETAYAEEYMKVTTDSEGRMLYGVKRDGTFTWQKGTPRHVIEACNPTMDNPEWLYLIKAPDDTVLFGIKRDGSVSWHKGTPQHVIEACNPTMDNSEYLYAILDPNDTLLFGIKRDGSVTWGKGIPQQIKTYIEDEISSIPSPPLSPIQGKKWAAFGDSITEGNSTNRIPYQVFVAENTGVTALNYGVGSTGYMKQKANTPSSSFYDRIQNINPNDFDVLTIFGSGNDKDLPLGDITDSNNSTVLGCVNLTIDAYLSIAWNKPLGIVTPYPWAQFPVYEEDNWMDRYSEAIMTIARKRGIPCIDLYHESGIITWDPTFRQDFFVDSVHINSDGAKTFLMPKFREFLLKLI